MSERDKLEEDIRACRACELAGPRRHALPGEGDPKARLMLIAQAPGEREDREARMFCGPSGPILDDLLGAAGLERAALYMTNLVKCHLPHNRRPRQAEIDACAPLLGRELALVRPEVLVPLGYYATRQTLARCGVAASGARADFARHIGALFVGGPLKIYPLPHPSSLLYHRTRLEAVRALYARLAVLARPCSWYALCPLRRFTAQGRLDPRWVETYCRGDWSVCRRRLLEEQGQAHPDWMLPDGSLAPWLRDG